MIKIIHTNKAPQCLGPYVQAINVNNIIFISGQIGICPTTKKLSEDIKKQTYQALKNIQTIIQESGYHINNIIKTTIFTNDINNLETINIIYQNFFHANQGKYPARSCVEVSKLPKNAKIEIEAIATTVT